MENQLHTVALCVGLNFGLAPGYLALSALLLNILRVQ